MGCSSSQAIAVPEIKIMDDKVKKETGDEVATGSNVKFIVEELPSSDEEDAVLRKERAKSAGNIANLGHMPPNRGRTQTVTTLKAETRDIEVDGETRPAVNEWILGDALGRGSFGEVFIAEHALSSMTAAVKIMSKIRLRRQRVGRMGNALQETQKEMAILKKLKHPNIVDCYEIIDDPKHEKLYMVFEFVDGGTIKDNLSEKEAQKCIRDCVLGLQYVHKQNIIHRDIKPENVLQGSDGRTKLSDFGVSSIVRAGETITKTAGTPAFYSPEMCTGESYLGPPVDIWALGVTLFNMITGKVPFTAPNTFMLFTVIEKDPLVFPEEPKLSPELKDLLERMLDKNPKTRITLHDIKTHPWIASGGLGPCIDPIHDSMSIIQVTEQEVANSVTQIEDMVFKLGRTKSYARKFSNAVRSKSARSKDEGNGQEQE